MLSMLSAGRRGGAVGGGVQGLVVVVGRQAADRLWATDLSSWCPARESRGGLCARGR